MTKKVIRDRYSMIGEKKAYGTKIEGESLTDASQIDSTDLKIMAAKFGINSILPKTEVREEMFGWDLTTQTNIQQTLDIKNRMYEYFMEMPAIIRKEFKDNPDLFYEVYRKGKDSEYYELFEKHGIIKREVKNDEKILEKQVLQTSDSTNGGSNNQGNNTTNGENVS